VVASGEPVIVLSVWLVPEMVTGPALPRDALLASTNVSESVPPLHAAGIDPSEMLVTTPFTVVQAMVMPLSEPHELTLALALTIFCDVGVLPPATAAPGTVRTVAVTMASAAEERTMLTR
jgi:hypothetical protein